MSIISTSHRYIFIHVPKNAGTSIVRALEPWTYPFWQKVLHRLRIKELSPKQFSNHIYAEEIVNRLGKERFREFFSFGFVRNPWDRCLSLYTYGLKNPNVPEHSFAIKFKNFSDYLYARYPLTKKHSGQVEFLYSTDGEQLVSFIGRYENLSADFAEVCRRIGISATLPHENRSGHTDFRNYYDTKMVDFVAQVFARDITQFGYSFE